MAEKDSLLVTSPLISCNHVCAALKEKGLPYDSVWMLIGHIINNIEKISTFDDEQRLTVKEAFDDYLTFIREMEKAEVERTGLNFLAEIDTLKCAKVSKALKAEQNFNGQLLNSIGKNLHQLYSIIKRDGASSMINSLKESTLQSIKSAKTKEEILQIVEAGFNDVNKMVKATQEKMELSMESMLVLESNAIIDKLTGIFNRRFFDQELPKVVQTFWDRKGRIPFCLLLIDIDNFKEVNDTYGHFIGDRVLQRVAATIQNNSRAGIDSPIRLGGDEFALFLIGTNELNANKKGEIIRNEIGKKPMNFNFTQRDSDAALREVSFTVEVSIGVCELDLSWKDVIPGELGKSAVFCDPDETPICKLTCMLAESADRALYEAKARGRNQVRVYRWRPEDKS